MNIERVKAEQVPFVNVRYSVHPGIDCEAAAEKKFVDLEKFAKFLRRAQAALKPVEKPPNGHDLLRRPAVGHVFIFVLDVRVRFQ